MKVAVLSMDIENWYHVDYFRESLCDKSRSLLDGLDVYLQILEKHDIRSSFFVLGELAASMRGTLTELSRKGHDLGVHGWDHLRPMQMTIEQFAEDLRKSKDVLEEVIGVPAAGYRAPCFSLDRQRLDLVEAAGFDYDSSRILFRSHPLYGTLDLQGFQEACPNIFRRNDFFEFQVSTMTLLKQNIPVSGGGYLRIFPWLLMRRLIHAYLRSGELYVLYIHPYELSPQPSPKLPANLPMRSRVRFKMGRAESRKN